jgi:hypothetical protein
MSHFSVEAKLETVSSNLHYHVRKQVQLLSLLLVLSLVVFEKRIYSDILLFIFISTNYVINFP